MRYSIESEDPLKIVKFSWWLFSDEDLLSRMYHAFPHNFLRPSVKFIVRDEAIKVLLSGCLLRDSKEVLFSISRDVMLRDLSMDSSGTEYLEIVLSEMRYEFLSNVIVQSRSREVLLMFSGIKVVGETDDNSGEFIYRFEGYQLNRFTAFGGIGVYFTLTDPLSEMAYSIVHSEWEEKGVIDLIELFSRKDDDRSPDQKIRTELGIAVGKAMTKNAR